MAFREQSDQDLFNRFILTNYNLTQLRRMWSTVEETYSIIWF